MSGPHICGLYFLDSERPRYQQRVYLPQVKLDAHTTIRSKASRTVLKQTFRNASSQNTIDEVRYTFPLFDGVSIVDFVCHVGERTIYGLVQEKMEARRTYREAKERGEKAALLEQLPDAADVFTTTVSNIPESSTVDIVVTYVQELKHDAEVDGIRLNIPTKVAPRYGCYPYSRSEGPNMIESQGISIKVDVHMADGIPIKKIISPSHHIEVNIGSLLTSKGEDEAAISKASATLALGTTELEKDFVLQIVAKDVGVPQAILETHPTLPNQRALMTTLVPKFSLKPHKPEVIFLADRSGSMERSIPTLISALNIFLKSIPVGCMFNICSFGNDAQLLWPKSQPYTQETLAEALGYVKTFSADFGGTETLVAVKHCVEARHKEMPTELMLLTDGDIWEQASMFDYVSKITRSGDVRVFPIGIGSGVSSAFIEGVARAGRGFAQMVANNEKMNSKIIRMLKGALTPHINDYNFAVRYEDDSIESVANSRCLRLQFDDKEDLHGSNEDVEEKKSISLCDPNVKESHSKEDEPKDIFDGLPTLDVPNILQTPHEIPPLFPFNRTCVYLLMGPETSHLIPKSVILKGTSQEGPLELEIPVLKFDQPDETIHQLAARKATQELEEGGGWIRDAIIDSAEGDLVSEKYPVQFALLKQREAVKLGVRYQVGGKFCSFVAVEANEAEIAERRSKALRAVIEGVAQDNNDDWEVLEDVTGKSDHDSDDSEESQRHSGAFRFLRDDCSDDDIIVQPIKYRKNTAYTVAAASYAKGDEIDYSDEDMGFGLFDDDSPPRPPIFSHQLARPAVSLPAGQPAQKMIGGYTIDRCVPEHIAPLLDRLIALQAFDGSWPLVDDIPWNELNIDANCTVEAFGKLNMRDKDDIAEENFQVLVCTVIMVLFMEKILMQDEETWELVVEKARSFVEQSGDVFGKDIVEQVWQYGETQIDKSQK